MPKLALGVLDLPYSGVPTKATKANPRHASTVSTGDVATILEDKYQVMETFFDFHSQEIGDALANGMAGALENLMMGAPVQTNPFGGAESQIKSMFQKFLDTGEMDGKVPGVPTQAAQDRASGKKRSARMKNKRASNAKAVSFVDSGLYESSFLAWIK